jgi:hypothetical protein
MRAPTLPTAVTKAAHALLGLAHSALARVLPWAGRSQQDADHLRYWEALNRIARMAERESATGAPGGMVAVYVRLAVMHTIADHAGPWQECGECHFSLPAVRMPSSEKP